MKPIPDKQRIQVETLYGIALFYMALELFEISWQKAGSLMKMMVKLYQKYDRSVLLFLLFHPTYYFAIWLALATDYNAVAVAIVLIKTLDITTKILLIQQIFEKRELSPEMTAMLLTPIPPLLPYLSLFIYTPLVMLALL